MTRSAPAHLHEDPHHSASSCVRKCHLALCLLPLCKHRILYGKPSTGLHHMFRYTSSPPCLLHPVHPHTGSVAADAIIEMKLCFYEVKAQAIPTSLYKRLQASPPKHQVIGSPNVHAAMQPISMCRLHTRLSQS